MNPLQGGDARLRAGAHLERVSALIQAGQYPEAEVEIIRALSALPSDVRALKLLALIRFKLGRFAEAREAYQALAKAAPDDAGVRLNLGLIALKLEWVDEAVAELEVAARLRPGDRRVWGYLGFAYARAGRREAAAEALRRGGQEELAVQALAGQMPSGRADVREAPHPPAQAEAGSLAAATGAAPVRVAADPVPADGFEAEPDEPAGDGIAEVEGFAPAPEAEPRAAAAAGTAHPSGVTLSSFVLARLLPDLDSPEAVTPAGIFTHQGELMRFNIDGEAVVSAAGLVAVQGEIEVVQARRREQGRLLDRALTDGINSFSFTRGSGCLWLSGRVGSRLAAVRLEEDVLFVRQDRVVVFADDIVWESGRLPADGLPLLQLRGTGRVVLALGSDEVVALKVTQDAFCKLWVERERLIGWIGRVVPRAAGQGGAGHLLACEGDGIVLVMRHRNA